MKKSLAGIIAAAMAATAVLTPTSANAQWVYGLDNIEKAMEEKGYTRVDNVTFFEWALYENVAPEEDYYVYVNEDGRRFVTVNKVEGAHDAYFTLADGVTKEDVENALYEEYKDNYEKVQFWLDLYAREPVPSYSIMRNCTHSSITKQEAVEYLEFLKEQQLISGGKLVAEKYNLCPLKSMNNKNEMGITLYELFRGDTDQFEIFKEFVENELEGYSVDIFKKYPNSYLVDIVPPEGATLYDQIETAQKIYEGTHLSPYYSTDGRAFMHHSSDDVEVDVYNALKGDANCDRKVTIADPVAILQNIANKDKYGLSAQGKFNGDVTGEYDGLTAADAYELQVVDSQK